MQTTIHRGPIPLQAADQQFPLVDELLAKMIVQVEEEFFVADDFLAPCAAVHALEFLKRGLREVEPLPVHVFVVRLPAKWCFFREGTTAHAIRKLTSRKSF